MFWTQLDVIPDLLFSCIESSTARISSGQHRLHLTSVCIGEYRPFGACLKARTDLYRYLKDRQYKEISLNRLFTNWKSLVGFVKGDNLTKLELVRAHLIATCEAWPLRFYQWLRSMPKLESLELECVGDVHDEPLFKGKICWQSQEEIQTGLDKLISEIEA